ncbi:MAG TPA: FISUMP domain-containing protein [Fibrobacteraceae bacterium]|nr:FISUMP domain-containing protein [Fibrobacteraceae bacterium]
MAFPNFCLGLFLVWLLASCSFLKTDEAEDTEVIHYHIDLEEAGLTDADSVTVDIWQASNADAEHQLITEIDKSVVPMIDVPESTLVTLLARVYQGGGVVGGVLHSFVAGRRVSAKDLSAMDFTTERYAGIYDTVSVLADFESFGFTSAACSADGATDVGNCALYFAEAGDRNYTVTYTDASGHRFYEGMTVHVLQGTPTVGTCPEMDGHIGEVFSFGICGAADIYTNGISGGIAMYKWDYNGDGVDDDSSATDSVFSHAYPDISADTTYTAKLTVIDNDGNVVAATAAVHVVNIAPQLGTLFPSDATPITNQIITLSAPTLSDEEGNQIDSLWWDLDGDGVFEKTAAAGTVQTTSFSAVGSYSVSVYAQDIWKQRDTASLSIFVSSGFIDSRDGLGYRQTVIGNQTWMAENLNYDTLDGTGSWCYNDTSSYCAYYGRLYNWTTVMSVDTGYATSILLDSLNHRGLCPDGWRVPTSSDWSTLITYVGTSSAGTYLKANSDFWDENSGTDDYDFSALPGGYYIRGFSNLGLKGFWWTSSESEASTANIYRIVDVSATIYSLAVAKTDGFSLRCIFGVASAVATSSQILSSSTIASSSSQKSSSSVAFSSSLQGSSSAAASSSSFNWDSCVAQGACGTFTDSRDSLEYKYTTIGSQVWMAENLNYGTVNGSSIRCYDNDSANCDTYGRLYTWAAAMGADDVFNDSILGDSVNHQGICPSGWHVPSALELDTLVDHVGGVDVAGGYLKANSSLWNENNGTNAYGFSALPGGYYNGDELSYSALGDSAHWWTASELVETGAISLDIYSYTEQLEVKSEYKSNAFSLRCIQDP